MTSSSYARRGQHVFIVKRVVGVPDDTVEMRSGQVFVNREPLEQRFITDAGVSLGSSTFSATALGKGASFLLGDNRTNSADSRL